MASRSTEPLDERSRFEVLPVGRSDEEAARLPEPVRLTITCSPKHGPDRSVQTAARLRALGHAVTVHLAARMVRNRSHLDSLLAGMEQAGVDDIFLIGGDTTPPRGPYASAIELLPLIRAHAHGPRTIGIAAYPEGHPLIDPRALDDALQAKSALADYVTTQLCFDPDVLLGWLRDHRARGLSLPAFIGVPGKVPRRRLLEMSMRIGVGRSVRFLREQRGVQNLFGRSVADRLYDALAPSLEDPGLNITGFHYYTFNDLVDTFQWEREKVNARTALDARRGSDRAMSVTRRI